ncbi:hypothetical protein COHA_003098 [Chlorella ohadii]|uniref:Uncharacterized protein n=1 Tax=Chlorella ohadii TaxID=2649997 RepID=A0AAD5DSR1_9CHLO|nr:hypothetical protein COHA_003098 [Chlorella ohadii]
MAFNGSLPEINNGRLAMLGFLAALGCEVFTGKPVLAQLAGNGSTILTWVLLVTAGTAVPILRGIKNEEAFGPLTPERELFNGRAAMIGFASLLIAEAFRGSALF